MLTPSEYYRDPEVRERIAEYCGGTDTLDDFNCVAQQEKGYCVHPYCGFSLKDYRREIRDQISPDEFVNNTV